jgi:hypothetical protein
MAKCKTCKDKFEPKVFLQKNCLKKDECIKAELELKKKASNKNWNKEKKQRKEALKTNSDYVRELQSIFNTYIRERDKNEPCISCPKPLSSKFDAGHYYSTGSYPELRFNEDNVHGQCVHCNQHKRGNLIEYLEGLHTRIGLVKILKLKELANVPRKYTIQELKGLKVFYKLKIKNLKDSS